MSHANKGSREYDLTAQDFAKICQLIHTHAGIALTAQKEELVYGRLSRRIRALQMGSFREYLQLLDHPQSTEWQPFVNALTTNLTHFFREEHHFMYLAEYLKKLNTSGTQTLWCCASSTGEEAYSIAMAIAEIYPENPPFKIIATDIDTAVIQKAVDGIYTEEHMRGVSAERRSRFFYQSDKNNWVVSEKIKAMVDFRPLNLLAAQWSVRAPLLAIFCRNVMIYFDKETQSKILNRFIPLLAKNGRLFMGHSENIASQNSALQLLGRTIYGLAENTHD